jgi:methionyl-tRNA formyltransferase
LQKEVKIEDKDTSVTLEEKLRKYGAELLVDALKVIDGRNYRLVDQDEDKVILAPKLNKEDGLIDWGSSAVDIHNQIRGLLPWPAAFTRYRGRMLKIFQSDVLPLFPNHKPMPGEVVRADKDLIIVACARGFLAIKELQLEAGKRMFAQSFISGHKLTVGERLD